MGGSLEFARAYNGDNGVWVKGSGFETWLHMMGPAGEEGWGVAKGRGGIMEGGGGEWKGLQYCMLP